MNNIPKVSSSPGCKRGVLACPRVSANPDAWSMIGSYPGDKGAVTAWSTRVIYNFSDETLDVEQFFQETLHRCSYGRANAYIGGPNSLTSQGIYHHQM